MDLVKFTDGNGRRRLVTLRSLPGGIVQALDGPLSAAAGAKKTEVHLCDADGKIVARLEFDIPDETEKEQ